MVLLLTQVQQKIQPFRCELDGFLKHGTQFVGVDLKDSALNATPIIAP